MARFNFRQGIARRQEDGLGNPTFLLPNGQHVDLIVSPDPTLLLFAHFDEDYSAVENVSVSDAWGPFTPNQTAWLYWDIDLLTGELTRGFTEVAPIDDLLAPVNPVVDQHWFDMNQKVQKVWSGSRWVEHVRLFAAEYTNAAVLHPQPIGTQAGLTVESRAGYILYDNEQKPLKKFRRDMRGQFITTEHPLASQFSRNANFRIEAATVQGKAIEHIPIHHAMAYFGYNEVGLSRNTDVNLPSFGISVEDMIIGETRTFITKGYIQDDVNFNWTEPAGTPLFVGPTGELVTSPPQQWSMQRVGEIVDPFTIFVDIHNHIILD